MQHLIAYLLQDEARTYHANLSDALAAEFRLEPVRNRIEPHITLKAPFDARDIATVERILKTFSQKEKPQPLRIGGFNHFDGKVIFMDVTAPKQTHMLVKRLQDQLRNIPWMEFKRVEFPVILHATLCYPKNPMQCKEILSSLKRERVEFDIELDSITILQKPSSRWDIYREFDLSTQNA